MISRKSKVKYEIISCSPDQTFEMGRTLGRLLKNGDLILFTGDLGAGKTMMIKGIADGLGIEEYNITSPTFTVINEYQGRFKLNHIDLFRINNVDDLYTTGIEEYFSSNGITAIEWAERIEALLPDEFLRINILIEGETDRRIFIEGCGERYKWLAKNLKDEFNK